MQRLRNMMANRRLRAVNLLSTDNLGLSCLRPAIQSRVSLRLQSHLMGLVCLMTALTAAKLSSAEDSPFYAAGEVDFRRQRVINQTLLRDPHLATLLSRFSALIEERKFVEAVSIYQQLIDEPDDSFVWDKEDRIETVRQLANKIFEEHTELWSVYDQLYGATASQLLLNEDADTCRKVATKYFQTTAGREAMLHIVRSTWDRGRFEESLAATQKLMNSVRHREHLDQPFLARAQLLVELNEVGIGEATQINTIAKIPTNFNEWTQELSSYRKSVLLDSPQWTHARQLETETAVEHTPPMLSPEWQIPYSVFAINDDAEQENASTIRQSLEQWSLQRNEQLHPEITSLFAVCANGTLVYRDLDRLVAYPLNSMTHASNKRPLWQFKSLSSLTKVLQDQVDPYTGITTNHPGLERLHLDNSITSSLTTNGQLVYFVDEIQRTQDPALRQTTSVSLVSESSEQSAPEEDRDNQVLTNRLAAIALIPDPKSTEHRSKANDAQLAWSINSDGWECVAQKSFSRQPHRLAGHFFFGPPTLSGDTAYVVSEKDSYHSVSALNAETGQLKWTQPISYVDRPLERDVIRANQALPIVCAQGKLLCDNGNGQLVALDARLGTLQWTYCYADTDSRQASGRWTYSQSTRHSHAGVFNIPVVCQDAVLIMPERSGYIRCCDLKTGELRWSIPRAAAEYIAGVRYSDEASSHSNRSNALLAVGDHHCRAIDAQSGATLWETRTGVVCGHGLQVDNLYLLPVTDERPVLSTSNAQRVPQEPWNESSGQILAINLQSGEVTGYDMREAYGAQFSKKSSKADSETQAARHMFPLGNLIAYNDHIISIGVDKIVSFRQAGSVIDELSTLVDTADLSEAQLQELAQAEIIMGQTDLAGQHLRHALQMVEHNSDVREVSLNLYRELLYQQLQQHQKYGQSQESLAVLDQIEELIETDEHQARFLVKEIEHLVVMQDTQELWRATDRFAKMGMHIAIPAHGQPGHVRTSTSWIPGIYSQLLGELSHEQRQEMILGIRNQRFSKMHEMKTAQLETFLDLFSEGDQSSTFAVNFDSCNGEEQNLENNDHLDLCRLRDQIACELVERFARDCEYQNVELILLRMQKSCLVETRHYALKGLIALYAKLDCHKLAAESLVKLSASLEQKNLNQELNWQPQEFELRKQPSHFLNYLPHPELTDDHQALRFADDVKFLVHFDRMHPTWKAYQYQNGSIEPIRQVNLQKAPSSLLSDGDPFSKKRMLHENHEQGWILAQRIEKSQSTPKEQSEEKGELNLSRFETSEEPISVEEQHLQFLNRSHGSVRCEFILPGTRIGLANSTMKQVGHLVPVVANGRIYGVSLLSGKPIWERGVGVHCPVQASTNIEFTRNSENILKVVDHNHCSQRNSRVEIGPVGDGFCLIQTTRAITCIDPANGRLLWKRTDLNPQGGLWTDRNSGLIGDENVTMYFHPDQNTHSLLSTKTGRLLKTTQLEQEPFHVQRTRQSFGRNILYLAVSSESPHERYLRLWDPKNNRLLLNQQFTSNDLYHTSDTEITILTESKRLFVYNPASERMVVDLILDAEVEKANYLRVVKQGHRYLVNLYQTQRIEEPEGYTSRFTDAPWKMTHINGPLLSINSRSNQLEWSRTFPHRTIIEEEGEDLPFIVMAATHQQRPGDQSRSLLLEILDPATGNTLESQNNLDVDRLLLLNHDRQQQKVVLSSEHSDLIIDYNKDHLSDARRYLSTRLQTAEIGRGDY
ncbi:PQQ-binding-like beta-propeller repeat protein [uncultured Rubinisphaera sp.]|uniref:outer membrane protein assembly factor BamB family protein n=1 Tax=uncultured Rubinisphaera sp. TaxID=1678686 RepID=UPI0030DA9EB6